MIQKISAIVILGLVGVLAGCASSENESESGTTTTEAETAATGPSLGNAGTSSVAAKPGPTAEEIDNRTKRLQYLENALESWNAAAVSQEYARRDSLANVLKTYTSQNWPVLLEDMREGSPRFRQTMAAALGFSGRPEVVPALVDGLKDPYFEVVLHSLLGLSTLAQNKVSIGPDPILPYLDHEKAEIRSNAALVLSRILTPESPREYLLPLISAAEDKDDATRVHAIAAMGAMNSEDSVPHLVKALRDPIELVRIRAAIALGRTNSRPAVPYLIDLLSNEDEKESVKKAGVRALIGILGVRPEKAILEAKTWRAIAESEGIQLNG